MSSLPSRVFCCFALIFLLVIGLTGTSSAQQAAPAGEQIDAGEARSTLEILKDDKRRAALIDTLETIARADSNATPVPAPTAATGAPAEPAGAPESEAIAGQLPPDSLGSQLIVQASGWMEQAKNALQSFSRTVADVPQLWSWAQRTVNDPVARYSLFDALWKLAVILIVALAAEFVVIWLIRRPLNALDARPNPNANHDAGGAMAHGGPSSDNDAAYDHAAHDRRRGHALLAASRLLIRRLPFALLHGILEAIPVVIFAAAGNGLLATPLGEMPTARMTALAVLNAYVLLRFSMCVVRIFTNCSNDNLRLLPLDGETAAYIEVWVRRILATGLFGAAIAEVGLILGLAPTAHLAILKLVVLLIHLYVVIILLQSRHSISRRIAGRPEQHGSFAAMRRRLAMVWIYPALFLVLALWIVWAIQLQNGLYRLFTFFALTIVVLLVARLATILVLGALDRLFRISPELHQRYPALEARTNRYYPILRRTLLALVCVTTFIVLLEAWGLDAVSWFSGNAIGRRLVSAAITVLIAALIAVIVWEFITGVLDRHLNTLNREGHYVRAARLRTLVPMLRTVLLSIIVLIVGLTLLSQIGVNIAPLLAGAGIVGVAIGFGSQKLVQDFITGIFLLLENAMQVGDFVTVSGLSGTVEALSIRTMRLRAGDGSLHIVPFSSVSTVTNVNRGMGNASVQVTISSREDTDRVGEVLKDIGRGMREDEAYKDMILADFSLWGVDRIDGATATIVGQMPCTDKGRWGVQREFNRRIKKRFHEEGIEIAVPTQLMIVERRVQTQDKVWRPAEQPVEADGGAIPESPPASALGQ